MATKTKQPRKRKETIAAVPPSSPRRKAKGEAAVAKPARPRAKKGATKAIASVDHRSRKAQAVAVAQPHPKRGLQALASFGASALGLSDPGTRLRAVASLGTSLLRVNRGVIVRGVGRRPAKNLVLFEAEYCPFCRHVREALTELDLDAMIYPVPKGGKRHVQRLKKLGGKAKIPFLHDPNTGTKLYEADAIVKYLYKEYGLECEDVPARRLLTSTLATLTRGKQGMFARPNKAPGKPLELYSFEGSPYGRLARETFCELEIPYLLHNVGKTPGAHADYLPGIPGQRTCRTTCRAPKTGASSSSGWAG